MNTEDQEKLTMDMIEKSSKFPVYTFDGFLLTTIAREKTYNLVEEYNMRGPYSVIEEGKEEDTIYNKNVVIAAPLDANQLKEQYLEQVKSSISGKVEEFDYMVQLAQTRIKDNYGKPNTIIRFSESLYSVVDTSYYSIRLKLISDTRGAIVVYKPKAHCLIHIES